MNYNPHAWFVWGVGQLYSMCMCVRPLKPQTVKYLFFTYFSLQSRVMLPQAYLTERQLEIWSLRFKGFSKAEVGRRLGITRQAVYDAEKYMLEKVESALRHVAEASRIDVRYLDPSRGVLLGFNPLTNSRVIVTFSARNGVQTWHYEQPNCGECQWEENCKRRLLDEAEEREIQLSSGERELPPSKLAHLIFSKIIPGLEP